MTALHCPTFYRSGMSFGPFAFARRHIVGALMGVLVAAAPIWAQEPSIQITFLDVGQGDAVVIRAPEGQTAMIDAGPGAPLRFLQQMNIEGIDLLVATHPHADHIGGMVDVLTARPVRFYMDNGQSHTTATYRRLMEALERLSEVTYLEAVPRSIALGSASIEVLPLPPVDAVDHNNRSVGLVVRFGRFSAFFSGDSEEEELTHFVRSGVVPDVTLLKAAHHGSQNGFTRDFLEVARPEVVVISVGRDNSYEHPRPEALTAFSAVASDVFRTDRDGHVTILGYADGTYEVVLGRDRDEGESTESGGSDTSGQTHSATESEPGNALLSLLVIPDAPGDDHRNLNGEYVVIESHASNAVDLGRWLLCDVASRCFRFPDDARIEAGRRVVVYTGYGVADGVSFFMNNGRAVWNNDGDVATLFDAQGSTVLRYVYE
ncbi:MAG: lamin tail domain-containing protein [Gemmatimonadetes bacterium]|nr:lamin tail domain-containing protein [Gemmatimonadota bacterium]MDA1103354.1 lamin tail domain-containing protein [Gemmatimonadota bacterium]